MKYYVYYNPIKDILGLSTDKKKFQFSEEPNFFYSITKDYVLIDSFKEEETSTCNTTLAARKNNPCEG